MRINTHLHTHTRDKQKKVLLEAYNKTFEDKFFRADKMALYSFKLKKMKCIRLKVDFLSVASKS